MLTDEILSLIKMGKVTEARLLYQNEPKNTFMSSDQVVTRFTHQNDFGPHEAFDTATDWKKYFLFNDALHNITDDVVFSSLEKYICEVGCKVCYLDGYWMDEKNKPQYTTDITEEQESNILRIFSFFDRANAIDDLVMLRRKYPNLYSFYQRNSHLMEHNITDNGFFSQHEILTTELNFKKIAYLSFSDDLLDRNDGQIVDRIIPMFESLNARSPIHKVNFIASKGYPTENPQVMRLFRWVVENTNADTYFHTDLCQPVDWVADLKTMYGYDLPSIYYQENARNPPIICQILTETIQLRKESFYATLTGSCIETADAFYHAHPWDPVKFLPGVIKGKIRAYRLYRDSIEKKDENRYYEYFRWVVDNVRVRDDYNFIPWMMLKANSTFYKELVRGGYFIETPQGLIRPNAAKIVPLVEV